jgi:hypothetical protein
LPDRDGSQRYEAYIRTVETRHESSRLSESIDVFDDETDEPVESPDDCGGGGWLDPGSGDSGDGSDGGLPWLDGGESDAFDKLDTLILLAIVLGAVYVAGQLFDIQIDGGSA